MVSSLYSISSFSVSPMIWVPAQLVGAYHGDTITLTCFVEAHPASLNYWEKEGVMVHQDEHYHQSQDRGTPAYKVSWPSLTHWFAVFILTPRLRWSWRSPMPDWIISGNTLVWPRTHGARQTEASHYTVGSNFSSLLPLNLCKQHTSISWSTEHRVQPSK